MSLHLPLFSDHCQGRHLLLWLLQQLQTGPLTLSHIFSLSCMFSMLLLEWSFRTGHKICLRSSCIQNTKCFPRHWRCSSVWCGQYHQPLIPMLPSHTDFYPTLTRLCVLVSSVLSPCKTLPILQDQFKSHLRHDTLLILKPLVGIHPGFPCNPKLLTVPLYAQQNYDLLECPCPNSQKMWPCHLIFQKEICRHN